MSLDTRRKTKVKRPKQKRLIMSAEVQAELEILDLWGKHSRQVKIMVGGPTPPKMLAENRRLSEIFELERAAILAKHGVVPKLPSVILDKKMPV